jgi:hypothetical protein
MLKMATAQVTAQRMPRLRLIANARKRLIYIRSKPKAQAGLLLLQIREGFIQFFLRGQ